jgi:hypothetical protein
MASLLIEKIVQTKNPKSKYFKLRKGKSSQTGIKGNPAKLEFYSFCRKSFFPTSITTPTGFLPDKTSRKKIF